MSARSGTESAGVAAAVAAYGIWGFSPIFWKALASIPSDELLAHRVLWSVPVAGALLAATRSGGELAAVFRSFRRSGPIALAALLLSANWLTFIWAVNHDQILATALGYYINPLVSVALGAVVLRERLRPAQVVAVAVAAAGVLHMAIELGELPWIAVVLAGSFGLYGLVRKMAPVAPVAGFGSEMLMLAPLAGLYLATADELAVPTETAALNGVIVCSGLITAAPLVLFNAAAKRLPLATVGFFQYLAPSLSFALAVLLYREPFNRAHAVTFGCVWLALAIYSIDSLRARVVTEPPSEP